MRWLLATKKDIINILPDDKPLLIRHAKPWRSKNKKYVEYRLYITIPKEYKDRNVLVIIY